MKFDKMNTIFQKTKTGFNKYATKDHENNTTLTLENLIKAVQYIHIGASPQRISKIFDLSDVDDSRHIDYKEFLTALTLAETLNELTPRVTNTATIVLDGETPNPKSEDEKNGTDKSVTDVNELQEALGLIISAYLLYDPKCEGIYYYTYTHIQLI